MLLFCLVNYNCVEQIANFIRENIIGIEKFKCVIVENSERTYDLIEKMSSAFPEQIQYITDGTNCGYLNGLGVALDAGIGKWGQPDWVVFSNSDVKFSAQTLRDHLKNLLQISKLGVWGPEILSVSTASNQNPFLLSRPIKAKMTFYSSLYKFPTLLYCYEVLSIVKKRLFLAPARQRALAGTIKLRELRKVYAVHGSFFVLSKEFIENVKNVQWPCFLYGEEIWFAEMCNKYKLGIYYDPKFRVIHSEHSTTSYLSTKNKAKNYFQSIKYLLSTFWNCN